MNVFVTVYILCVLFLTGSAQPRFNRPHPLYNDQFNQNLIAALLFGLDYNEILGLQNLNSRGPGQFGRGGLLPELGFPPGRRGQQILRQELNALSLLGVIDGPDAPDGPRNGQGQGRRGGRGPKPGPADPAPAAGGEGAAEGAQASGPRREGPRRRGPRA